MRCDSTASTCEQDATTNPQGEQHDRESSASLQGIATVAELDFGRIPRGRRVLSADRTHRAAAKNKHDVTATNKFPSVRAGETLVKDDLRGIAGCRETKMRCIRDNPAIYVSDTATREREKG